MIMVMIYNYKILFNSGSGTLNYAAYSFHGDTKATGNTLETLASGGSDPGTIHGEVVLSSTNLLQ